MGCRIITCTTIMSERSWMEKRERGYVVLLCQRMAAVFRSIGSLGCGLGSAYSIDRPVRSAAWHRYVGFVYH